MSAHIGKLLLRFMIGGLMLFHGVHKALHGIDPIKTLVIQNGLPEFVSYGVYVGEILAPIFLIIGWKSRVWAAIIAFNMFTVIYLTQMGNFLKLGDHGSWALELQMSYLLGSLAIVLLGSGKYAVEQD